MMPRRGSRPSLYEVGRRRLDRSGQRIDSEGASQPPPPKFTPGGSVRLPWGFVILGMAFVVSLVLGAWWIGRGAGAEEARLDHITSGQARVVVDPLGAAATAPQTTPSMPESAAAPAKQPTEPEAAEIAAPSSPARAGDQRIPGHWYFVLAETLPEGAREIADFCEAQGLEVAVVSGHNVRLRKVVALPGLTSSRTTNPAYGDLDSRIADVGRRWRASGRRTSFEDRYLHQYQP